MSCSLSRIPLNIFTENFNLNVEHALQEPPELLAQAEPNSVKRLASGPRWDLNVKVCFKQKFNRSMMLKNQQHWLHDKKAKTSRFSLGSRAYRKNTAKGHCGWNKQYTNRDGYDKTPHLPAHALHCSTLVENFTVSLADCGFSALALIQFSFIYLALFTIELPLGAFQR